MTSAGQLHACRPCRNHSPRASSSTSDGVSSLERVDHAVRARLVPAAEVPCPNGDDRCSRPPGRRRSRPSESSMTRHSAGASPSACDRREVAIRARACCAGRPRRRRSTRTARRSPMCGSTCATSTRELPVTSARGMLARPREQSRARPAGRSGPSRRTPPRAARGARDRLVAGPRELRIARFRLS